MTDSRWAGKRAVFIINPAAGGLRRQDDLRAAIHEACAERGLLATIATTAAPGDATRLAAEAERDGAACLFVVGGDGTLNEAINGLTTSTVAVGQIPAGTANVWAKEAGIPGRPRDAIRAQLDARALTLDVGRAGDRRFLLMAGLGLDAAAVHAVGPRLKSRLGRFAYIVAGLRVGLRYPGAPLRLTFDDATPIECRVLLMICGNTRWYGGMTRFTPDASAVDGLLDCLVFERRGLWSSLTLIPRVLRGRHLAGGGGVHFRRARHVRIASLGATPLPLQIDGDDAGLAPGRIEIEPAAVTMLVPRAHDDVFRPTSS
jgi:diacylglycerol kinase (ATP)